MASRGGESTTKHPYALLVRQIGLTLAAMEECGLGDLLSKGGMGEILLAHELGHFLTPGDKGADAVSPDDKLYEYKVSKTPQGSFVFNFGGRPSDPEDLLRVEGKIRKKFGSMAGAFCGLRVGMTFSKIAFLPLACPC